MPEAIATRITQLLHAADEGDQQAAEDLLPVVYNELRQVAQQQMAGETPGQTLQPTALVHEAYLRLVEPGLRWESRRHFFAAAARAMRRILVDRARKRRASKHGGDRGRVDWGKAESLLTNGDPERLLALDSALRELEEIDQRKARIVMLRFFVGMTIEETAQTLGLSTPTVVRQWQFAKAWLFNEMTREQ